MKDRRPPADWPPKGSIQFSHVKMQYRPNLPVVLNDITFEIQPKEKNGFVVDNMKRKTHEIIDCYLPGIVGRTASGKSSLGVSLFRLVDLTSGVIRIDAINIAEIGLEDLRSKLSIIPQDPVFFIGIIRLLLSCFTST